MSIGNPILLGELNALVPKLKELRDCASQACVAARDDEYCKSEAVNWADFSCSFAEMYLTDEGHIGLRILLEEADPFCKKVWVFVKDYLADRGWPDVDVATEW